MRNDITLCIIGAGSSYTPELIAGILEHAHDQLPVTTINLYDINDERLGVMGALSQRMTESTGRDIRIQYSTDFAAMLDGIDFAVTQVRVGGMQARCLDESIPLKYGIIGQETTGPGGMFKALRTIPHMIEIADAVAEHAPQAIILNYTNPSGIISEAVARHTSADLIGLCSGIPAMMVGLHSALDEHFSNLKMYCVGLNHLGLVHRFTSEGHDVTDEALRLLCSEDEATGESVGDADMMRLLRAVPMSYTYYYFHRGRRIADARNKDKTRAQEIMAIEKEVFTQAAEPARTVKPEALKYRGGGGYSQVTFSFLKAICNNTGDELACTIQNKGAVNGIDNDAGVEIMARVDRDGATPIPVGDIPLAFRGIVQAVKAYETLTIEAAVNRSRDLAIKALLNHPLAGDLDVIEPMVDEMLKAHGLDYA